MLPIIASNLYFFTLASDRDSGHHHTANIGNMHHKYKGDVNKFTTIMNAETSILLIIEKAIVFLFLLQSIAIGHHKIANAGYINHVTFGDDIQFTK